MDRTKQPAAIPASAPSIAAHRLHDPGACPLGGRCGGDAPSGTLTSRRRGLSRGQVLVLLVLAALMALVAALWWPVPSGVIALSIAAIALVALALIAVDRKGRTR